MGEDSIREEIMQILRGLGSRVSHFVAFLFDPTNASSIGALAGFAIAIICTWKYLKAPADGRKRLDKREDSTSSRHDNSDVGASTSVALSQTQAALRSGLTIREPEVPIQVTISQIVRRQLNGGRKMTCQLLGVILEETTPEELQTHAVVRSSVVDVLLELAQACDLYLMTRILDDESEAIVLAALDTIGLFSVAGLNKNKVLFCSTEAGKASFVRQLEPDWHVDTSVETISQLARYIRYELLVSAKATILATAANVVASESLEQFFGKLNYSDIPHRSVEY